MRLRLVISIFPLVAATLAMAAPAPAPAVSFARDVAPILRERCTGCHDGRKAKGKYRLDSFEWLRKPGGSGEAPVVPGDPVKSPLHRLLLAADPDDRMPKDADPLPAAQIERIGRWIREGAAFDGPDPKASLDSLRGPTVHPVPPSRYPRPVPVAGLAFRPGGAEIASGGYHEVLVHDAVRGTLSRRITNIAERVAALAWSPDGARLAVAGGTPGRDGEVVLVDAAGGTNRAVLASSGDLFLAVAFAPGGGRLLAGGTDNAVSCFDVATGKRAWFLAHHADWVTGIAWNAAGDRFATSSRDRTARVCDGTTGEAVASFTEHGAAVLCVAFAPDGKQAWTGGRDARLRAWDAANSDTRQNLDGFDADVSRVAMVDGRVVAGAANGRIRRFAASDPKETATLCGSGSPITALAVDEASKAFAVGTHDGRVRIWKPDAAEPSIEFPTAP